MTSEPKCRTCSDLGKISLGYGRSDLCPSCGEGAQRLYLEPELDQDEGAVTLTAYTPDGQSYIAYTICDTYALVHRKDEDVVRFAHGSFIQPVQPVSTFDVDRIHPALQSMARAICLASGRPDDADWTIPDDGGDVVRPSWSFYVEHARQALATLTGLDDTTLMRGTAAINWDTLPPDDDLGDPDYAPDFDRMLKALVIHICKPLKKAEPHD